MKNITDAGVYIGVPAVSKLKCVCGGGGNTTLLNLFAWGDVIISEMEKLVLDK